MYMGIVYLSTHDDLNLNNQILTIPYIRIISSIPILDQTKIYHSHSTPGSIHTNQITHQKQDIGLPSQTKQVRHGI